MIHGAELGCGGKGLGDVLEDIDHGVDRRSSVGEGRPARLELPPARVARRPGLLRRRGRSGVIGVSVPKPLGNRSWGAAIRL